MRWTYIQVVRPALTYGCLFWGRLCSAFRARLYSLQRLALMQFGNFRRGTPSEGLNMFFNLPPLDLFIEGEMLRVYHRLYRKVEVRWDGAPVLSGTGYRNHFHHVKSLYGSFLTLSAMAAFPRALTSVFSRMAASPRRAWGWEWPSIPDLVPRFAMRKIWRTRSLCIKQSCMP